MSGRRGRTRDRDRTIDSETAAMHPAYGFALGVLLSVAAVLLVMRPYTRTRPVCRDCENPVPRSDASLDACSDVCPLARWCPLPRVAKAVRR